MDTWSFVPDPQSATRQSCKVLHPALAIAGNLALSLRLCGTRARQASPLTGAYSWWVTREFGDYLWNIPDARRARRVMMMIVAFSAVTQAGAV